MSDFAYIGRMQKDNKYHKAGTVVCATVDDESRQKDTAKDIAEWVRDGLIVERVPVEWVRKFLFTQEPYKAA